MKIIDQTCTLEQAKKLKKLGVLQISLFYFSTYWKPQGQIRLPIGDIQRPKGSHPHAIPYDHDREPACNPHCFSAFSVAELGVMLPAGDHTVFNLNIDNYPKEKSFWEVWHPNDNHFKDVSHEFGETEAMCRAELLIYLLEADQTGTVLSTINTKLLNY